MESGYQQRLLSPAGAAGVMQLTPATWRYAETVLLGHPVAHSLQGNIQIGIALLRHLLLLFGHDRSLALAAYLQGARSVHEEGIQPASQLYISDILALAKRL